MTGRGNNTYLLAEPDGSAALVDAGTGEQQHLDGLAAALDEVRGRLTKVLVTHGHHDHIGGAPHLARAHPAAAFFKFRTAHDDGGPIVWQMLRDGAVIMAGGEPLTVLHTPGHAPDHVALHHEP